MSLASRPSMPSAKNEREELERMRGDNRVGTSSYILLQEELDWRELTLLRDEERRIEES